MLVSTKAIVIHKTKYGDNAIIVKLYTEKFGTLSFIIKNAFSKKNKLNNAHFEPLALLEINFDNKKPNRIQFLNEINHYYHFSKIPFDNIRNSLLIFYNELLYKLLFDAGEDAFLYAFLEKSIINLDTEDTLTDIHIKFMIQLSKILGFYPDNQYSERNCYFNFDTGFYGSLFFENQNILSGKASSYLNELMNNMDNHEFKTFPVKAIRNELLNGLIYYFKLHNEHIKNIESVEIIADILN